MQGSHQSSSVVFRQHSGGILRTALPSSSHKVRRFHVEDCTDQDDARLVLLRGALSRPKALRSVKFSGLTHLEAREGALRAHYSHSVYVKKVLTSILLVLYCLVAMSRKKYEAKDPCSWTSRYPTCPI